MNKLRESKRGGLLESLTTTVSTLLDIDRYHINDQPQNKQNTTHHRHLFVVSGVGLHPPRTRGIFTRRASGSTGSRFALHVPTTTR